MTTYAARHVALGGDDPEPEGLASSWGDDPAPRRALMPEDAATSYATYEVEPELVPYAAVARQELPVQQATPSELGPPVVAPVPSQTMAWHLASASHAPQDPGPLDATPPVTFVADPASIPTPVSQSSAFAYQSMPSPSPYTSVLGSAPYASAPSPAPYAQVPSEPTYAPVAPHMSYTSAPAQGSLAAPMASPYANPAPYDAPPTGGSWVHRPQTVEQALELVLPPAAGTAVKVAVTVQRVFSLIFVLVVVGIFTAVGFNLGGGNTWFIVGFAWFVGIMMVVGLLSPGRGRLRWSVLK